MITRTFQFTNHLRRKVRTFDVIPMVDVCLIFIFFSLLSSKFVLAPGVSLHLPESRYADLDALPIYQVLTIGEIGGEERIIYDGAIHNLLSFERSLESAGNEIKDTVLLIRLDEHISVQTLVKVCDVARAKGFKQVQIAAEVENESPSGF
ncbi:MAG: biopolymer transporter ExbD [Opitutaceae bacterium]|nr:biopolymer transporter ExbD [Opitutaceae bacterium]